MESDKPIDITSYRKWLIKSHNIDLMSRMERYYQAVTTKVKSDFEKSAFWQSLQSDLTEIRNKYYMQTNYYLLSDTLPPVLCIKPFNSFILKTFRHNILNNKNWTDSPEQGWLFPDNWFSRVNDMIRTCFVVKYLDGVKFLAEQLTKQSSEANYKSRINFEAKQEGYYAAHFYVTFPCEVPCVNWDTRDEKISIEIQITTQLQEVIRRMLHKYYEHRRVLQPTVSQKWQWDYSSDEFAANYLGHILHYVEGMIMDVRNKQIRKDTTDEN